MSLVTFQIIWFLLIGILLAGYAVLDGFDLGVGNLYLFNKSNEEKDKFLSLIGPVWDSNQVWLITGGGAIFAAFPHVYATVFSGFYLALMLVLFALIFRAVSIEFQHQFKESKWQKFWDFGFSLGSILPSILFGVAIGNILRGIPLDSKFNFIGSFFGLLNPYSLAVGIFSFVMFTVQGGSFILAQTEGELNQRIKKKSETLSYIYLLLFLIISVWSYLESPQLFTNFFKYPILWILPLVVLISLISYPKILNHHKSWQSFKVSSVIIIALVGILGASLFPNLVPAINDISHSITVYNGSSSLITLKVMTIFACIGMPLVLFYTGYIYKKLVFNKKYKVFKNNNIVG